MPIFQYTAKNQAGETKTGVLEAKDETTLAQMLRQEGFILTQVKNAEAEPQKKKISFTVFLKGIFGRISVVDKLMFTRHLAIMVNAGFSLHKALEALAQQTENRNFQKVIQDLADRIRKGQTFADSLAKHPKVFDNFFISMVRVGEKGGNLEEVLRILTEHLKQEHEFISKVRVALAYPAVIVTAMVGIGILMMIMVVPKITAMFEELNTALPITTQILIAISKFLSRYYLIIGIALVVLSFFLIRFYKTKKGKQFFSWLFLKIPFFNKITQKINCARFSRAFASLMKSGVPIVESLNITAQILGNVFYTQSLIDAAEAVKKGKTIHDSLSAYDKIYPALVGQMIGVGEQTGELAEIMQKLADFYEEEVTNITQNLASIIEPVLMILIGAAVGFFAVSMIQPMYSMMGNI